MGWREDSRLPFDVLDDIETERAAISSVAPDERVPSIASGGDAVRSSGPLTQDPNASSEAERLAMLLDRSGDIEQTRQSTPAMTREQPAQPTEMPFDARRAILSFAGGDVGAYDRRKSEWDNRAFTQRKQTIGLEGDELDNQYRRGQIDDATLQRQQARSLIDPRSPQSLQAQQTFQRYLSTLAQAPGVADSALGRELVSVAQNVGNMSASQIAQSREVYDKLFGNTMKAFDTQSDAALAQQNADRQERTATAVERQHAAQLGLSWAEYQERQRHNMAMEDAKATVQVKVPPQTIVREFQQRSVALKEIARAKQLLASGKVRYTGKGANWLNGIMSVVPGQADIRTPEEREFAGLVKRIRAPERKNIFGAALSKYDISDSNQFMADIEQNPSTLLQNLDTLESALDDSQAVSEDTYPALVGDRASLPKTKGDTSAFKGAQPKPRGGDPESRPKAPAGAKVGAVYRDKKSGKRFKVREDMTLEEVP